MSSLGKTYKEGEIVVRQGEVGDCLFAIQEGKLEVVKEHKGRPEVRIAILDKGDIFGEMAIFEQQVRSATVRALTEARVLTVDKRTFIRRVQEDPTLAFNLVRMMSHRIRSMSDQAGEKRNRGDRRKTRDRRQKNDRRVD